MTRLTVAEKKYLLGLLLRDQNETEWSFGTVWPGDTRHLTEVENNLKMITSIQKKLEVK